jgi:hypothetical protein
MPDEIDYDEATQTLCVGDGRIAPVLQAAWTYQVSGMRVVRHWFGYRKRNPAGRRGSQLDDIKATSWTPETTTELLNLLNVLGRLVELQPRQADLLIGILDSPFVTVTDLARVAVLPVPELSRRPAPLMSADYGGQAEMF